MYLGFGVMGLVCLFFFRVVLVWFLFGWVFLIVFVCVCGCFLSDKGFVCRSNLRTFQRVCKQLNLHLQNAF